MSAAEQTSDPRRIWFVLDVTDPTAPRWLKKFGRVVDGLPVVPAVRAELTTGCANCGHTHRNLYRFSDAAGGPATCRACLGSYPAIAAIADDRDELDATEVDVTRVVGE